MTRKKLSKRDTHNYNLKDGRKVIYKGKTKDLRQTES